MKVLIADDDQTIRALLTDMLIDFLMPKLSGLDALKAMRERGLPMPAVLLTAISDSSIREMEDVPAPEAILEKPFRRRDIEKALELATHA